jgi:hypothetical protein
MKCYFRAAGGSARRTPNREIAFTIQCPTQAGFAWVSYRFPRTSFISLLVQKGDHLQRDSFWALYDHVVRKSRDGPEAHGPTA